MPIKLLVVDDHPVVLSGIVGMFDGHPDFDIIGTAFNGVEAVRLAHDLHPEIILMDLRMPQLDGIGAIRQILDQHPDIKILVLTTYDSDHDIAMALKAGAMGYLLKDAPRELIYEAILALKRGESPMSAKVAQHLLAQWRSADDSLTERELDVLRLVAHGMSNKAIGTQLYISMATVKTHLKHIYEKLHAQDRASAVAIALKRGLV